METALTVWHFIAMVVLPIMVIAGSIIVMRKMKQKAQKHARKSNLNSILTELTEGMTIEEVEGQFGFFDNIEMDGQAAVNKQYAFWGRDDSAYVSLLFVDNILRSWKMVA